MERFPPVDEIHATIRVYPLVLQVAPHVDQELSKALGRPAQDSREEGHAHGLHALQQVLAGDGAEQLVALALGPGVERARGVRLDDVDEAHLAHVPPPVEAVGDVLADAQHALDQEPVPLRQRRAVQAAVVAAHGQAGVLQLEVAAGLEVVEYPLHDPLAGLPGTRQQRAAVDVVERLVESPVFLFRIANLEVTVGG